MGKIKESNIFWLKKAGLTHEDAEKELDFDNNLRKKPCRLFCCDSKISSAFTNASKNLSIDKFYHELGNGEIVVPITNKLVKNPTSPITKAIKNVNDAMFERNDRLYRGYVYRKVPQGICVSLTGIILIFYSG